MESTWGQQKGQHLGDPQTYLLCNFSQASLTLSEHIQTWCPDPPPSAFPFGGQEVGSPLNLLPSAVNSRLLGFCVSATPPSCVPDSRARSLHGVPRPLAGAQGAASLLCDPVRQHLCGIEVTSPSSPLGILLLFAFVPVYS